MMTCRRQPDVTIMKLTAKDKSLDEAAIKLLREVERGVRVFQMEDSDHETHNAFQARVKLLRYLESRRFITEISGLNMTHRDGQSVIDRVCLRGGLTEKGLAVLAYRATPTDDA